MCFGNTTISQFTVVPNTATLQYAGMRQRIAASRMRVTMARSQSIRTVSQCADKTSSVQSSFLSMSDLARDIALANTNHLIGVVRTFSANRNFLSRLDNLDEYSEPAGCFEERSFSIWKLDPCFEDRSSGCSLNWHQIGRDSAGCHVRKLCDGAVDRKKCEVRRTAPSPDLPPIAVPKWSPKCMTLIPSASTRNEICGSPKPSTAGKAVTVNGPAEIDSYRVAPTTVNPSRAIFDALAGSQITFASGRSFRRRVSGS